MHRERLDRAVRHARTLTEQVVRELFADRATQLAAAISYYALFAIFPIVILAVAGFSLVLGEQQARQDVLDFLTRNLPVTQQSGRQDLSDLLAGVTQNTEAFGIVGVLGLLFSASGLMGALRNAVNTAWDLEDRRPPLQGKLLDLLLVLAIGVVIGLSLAGSLVTRAVESLSGDVSAAIGSGVFDLATRALPLAIAFAGFLLIYRVVPATSVRWRDAGLGALVATVGYAATKVGFGAYLNSVADYGAVYGSLGAIVAFVFFVYLNANVFVLGAEVASEWPRVRRGDYDRPDEQEDGDGAPWWRSLLGALRGLAVRDDERDDGASGDERADGGRR